MKPTKVESIVGKAIVEAVTLNSWAQCMKKLLAAHKKIIRLGEFYQRVKKQRPGFTDPNLEGLDLKRARAEHKRLKKEIADSISKNPHNLPVRTGRARSAAIRPGLR